jgi:hypothetical protein
LNSADNAYPDIVEEEDHAESQSSLQENDTDSDLQIQNTDAESQIENTDAKSAESPSFASMEEAGYDTSMLCTDAACKGKVCQTDTSTDDEEDTMTEWELDI